MRYQISISADYICPAVLHLIQEAGGVAVNSDAESGFEFPNQRALQKVKAGLHNFWVPSSDPVILK